MGTRLQHLLPIGGRLCTIEAAALHARASEPLIEALLRVASASTVSGSGSD